MRPVPFKWSFRAKQIAAEIKEFLYKARCNLRGDMQEEHTDFDPEDLYAPVAAHESIRMLYAISAAFNLILEGGDVNNAYLYGFLDTPIYMKQPTDSTGRERYPGMVCLLLKSIYGARQAGKIWGTVLHQALLEYGFVTSSVESRVYFLRQGSSFIILTIVVDDILFASNEQTTLNEFKHYIATQFDVKLYGNITSFIRWEVKRNSEGIKVTQTQYAKRLLARFGMTNCNIVSTPLGVNCDLRPIQDSEEALNKASHHIYRSIVGGLAYIATCTRPDLSFSVSALARHMHMPTERHLRDAKRVLRYLAGTIDMGLFYPSHPITIGQGAAISSLHAAVDADWGGDPVTRRSTTGFLIAINGAPIYWRSKRQTLVTLSSGEAEYVALSTCARELSWLRKLFFEVVHQTRWDDAVSFEPSVVEVDSSAAIFMAQRSDSTMRTKHIELKYHHVKELLERGIIQIRKVNTAEQVADALTKVSTRNTLSYLVDSCKLSRNA